MDHPGIETLHLPIEDGLLIKHGTLRDDVSFVLEQKGKGTAADFYPAVFLTPATIGLIADTESLDHFGWFVSQ